MAERTSKEVHSRLSAISDYLSRIGVQGGKAGTGKAKRRSKAQYKAMAAKSAQVRRAKREARTEGKR